MAKLASGHPLLDNQKIYVKINTENHPTYKKYKMQNPLENKNLDFLRPVPPKETPAPAATVQKSPDEQTGDRDDATDGFLAFWQAKEYEKIPRERNWYIFVFVSLFLLVAYALFTDNLLMAILFILAGSIVYLYEKKEPRIHDFGVTLEGVYAQNVVYEFSSLESFWIFYEPYGKKALSLKSKKSFLPYQHIPLGSANPAEIHDALIKFLPEVEQEAGLFDALEKYW